MRSRTKSVARADWELEPVAVAAELAALTEALKVLKKLPSAVVTSAGLVALVSVVMALAASWPLDRADLSRPNLEICAVVTAASDCMRCSAWARKGETVLAAVLVVLEVLAWDAVLLLLPRRLELVPLRSELIVMKMCPGFDAQA